MDLKEFGQNVAKYRIKANLSAYELSLRIGKDASYINKIGRASCRERVWYSV